MLAGEQRAPRGRNHERKLDGPENGARTLETARDKWRD